MQVEDKHSNLKVLGCYYIFVSGHYRDQVITYCWLEKKMQFYDNVLTQHYIQRLNISSPRTDKLQVMTHHIFDLLFEREKF